MTPDRPDDDARPSGTFEVNVQRGRTAVSSHFASEPPKSESTSEVIRGSADQGFDKLTQEASGTVADPIPLAPIPVQRDLEGRYEVQGADDIGPTNDATLAVNLSGARVLGGVNEGLDDTVSAAAAAEFVAANPGPNGQAISAPALPPGGPGDRVDGSAPGTTMAASVAMIEGRAAVRASGMAIRNVRVAGVANDVSDSAGRVDKLDVGGDATAFAHIAVSRLTPPPLAIGIFGSWGAGKSFFMDLIRNDVSRLAKEAAEADKSEEFADALHDKVLQIRFNAWHYAETNLWASLVQTIFQSLAESTEPAKREDVFGKLNTARKLTLEASIKLIQARREQKAAKDELEKAKMELAHAKAKPVRGGKLVAEMLASAFRDDGDEVKKARKELKDAAEGLGIGSVVTAGQELTEEGEKLLRDGAQARDIFWAIVKNIGSPGRAALFVFATIALPLMAVVGLRWAADAIKMVPLWSTEALTSAAALATVLSVWFKKAAGPMLSAVRNLKSAKARLDQHVRDNLKKFEDEVSSNEAEVAKASASVEAASELLKASSARLAEASEELHGKTAAGRLISFVKARASSGDYGKHLSLVSTVRKDLEELSALMGAGVNDATDSVDLEREALKDQIDSVIAEAAAAGKDELLTVDEVEKLKASVQEHQPVGGEVHPAFERIVLYIDDVDRCAPAKVVEVLQAVHMLLAFKLFVVFVAVDVRWLSSSLAQQYQGMLKDINSSSPLTSASDYLEKIFQIPYWLPTVSPDAGKDLLEELLAKPKQHGQRQVDASAAVQTSGAASEQEVAKPRDRYVLAEFDENEVNLLVDFGRVLNSPRKVKRFANIARFLKARNHLRSDYQNDEMVVPLIAQLAIATAVPEQFGLWQMVLRANSEKYIGDMMMAMEEGYLDRYPVVLETLRTFRDHYPLEKRASFLWPACRLAGRLSFSAPLEDADGKLFTVIKKYVDVGEKDFPLPEEIKARSLRDHIPGARPQIFDTGA